MKTLNLRDYYLWYTHDEYVDVPDDVANELACNRRQDQTHKRMTRHNKVRSLDAGDGTAELAYTVDNPETLLVRKEQLCRLCCALNSLPEAQGRRIEAHYLLGVSQCEIARSEGITKAAVSISMERGLEAMREILVSRICGLKR